jgi:HlyD family secretion protein
VAVPVLLVVGGGSWFAVAGTKPKYPELLTYSVHYETLQVDINERGQVEAVNNNDQICRIKAKSPNSNTSTSIKWVIDDGSLVQKGQKLMELDASALEDQRKTHLIDLDEARSTLVKAQGDYDSAVIQNRTKIASAKRAVEYAKIDLEKYREGDYLQKKKDYDSRILEAQSNLEMWAERKYWSEGFARRGYVTHTQAHSDNVRHQAAQDALSREQEQIRVLGFEKRLTETDKIGKIKDAEDNLEKAEVEAKADLEAKKATLDAAKTRYDLARSRLADCEEQIGYCTIVAPQSGMVSYYMDEKVRWGVGKQNLIAQGEMVSEGQKLLRIPDMSRLQVNTKVHEAMVTNVRGDVEERTGFTQAVWAASLLAGRDPATCLATHLFFEAAQEDFRQAHRNEEFRLIQRGQSVRVHIDALPGRELHGHVTRVSLVPSAQDFLSADIKLYPVMVAIDENLEGLRPGMSAQVTIHTDSHADRVLTVPLQAIVGSFRMGSIRKCYVLTPNGPEPRDVIVGLMNDQMAEIKSGLQEGDQVVVNPTVLLDEKERAEYSGGTQDKAGKRGGFKKGGEGSQGAPGAPEAGAPKAPGNRPGRAPGAGGGSRP